MTTSLRDSETNNYSETKISLTSFICTSPVASHMHSNPLLLFRDKVRKPVEVFVHQKSAR
jgi:hypothetical protein